MSPTRRIVAGFLIYAEEKDMASKTQKTEKIRARKRIPNQINTKVVHKRVRENLDVIAKLEKESGK